MFYNHEQREKEKKMTSTGGGGGGGTEHLVKRSVFLFSAGIITDGSHYITQENTISILYIGHLPNLKVQSTEEVIQYPKCSGIFLK